MSAKTTEPTGVGRPIMSAGYGLKRDTQGVLDWSWAQQQVARARSYWICTTRADGRPHAMPVWAVWIDGTLYFSTDPASVKGRNLAADPRVVVHLESGDDVVIIEGVVEALGASQVPASWADDYERKYAFRPEPSPEQGVYAVRHSVVLAWRESDFPSSAARWTFG